MITFLDSIPLPAFGALTIVIVLLAIEGGFRVGRSRRARLEDEKEGPVGAMVAATLGLLAFVLAFTFGLAGSRFDDRRTVVVEEANAIGTTYLRAGVLPDDRTASVRQILRAYVEARLDAARTGDLERLEERSAELHRSLWAEAEAVGRQFPDSIVVGLFVEAVNDTIDLHALRLFAVVQGRIPAVLWAALFVVTVLTMGGVGYLCAIARSRRSPEVVVLALSFSVILMVVADLDRPLEGFIRVSQKAMTDVRQMMDEDR